ncbi:MAG: phospho-N-acetylmuramoyl-pentapeptide-transferase [Anaerolineae bacterium]|uniref:phospho-N-acetylmuramoyl-pentapeptide- transferase n=1 Tax=Promineifilum sp. TaxID=2664178 RepID=UPI001DA32A97|nr:phospho-N-acetylmuramoyl-pentapeptide-transferase [Anaerolineales bacterium]MCB8936670.1 phospho-N-acetylmuramoyl-pentapeptide-transferase [Promineifilum sp.]MCO5179595.1 phospho-N-acetylmuramoyl-pentapeptide-transferase [Promineifilum sp.]MCW5846726.1 phospho-N-acetylmuramoyl-pentapeptide-transferase [Anaerolineae bacterium]
MGWALTVAAATFLLSVIWGKPLIEIMRRLRLGKSIRIEGPATHAAKMGTPAMGGILIVAWTLLVSLVVSIVQIIQALEFAQSLVIPLGVMLAYSILGGIDDYQGLRLRPGEGMRARVKIWIQLAIALVAAVLLYWVVNERHGWVAVPTVPLLVDIGLLYIPAAVILITGSANAVNLTDGLDGLAGLIAATAFVAYGIIAFLQDQQFLVVFSFIVIGSTFGFLWYNAKPAQMFMGDVGAQALGAALGVVALMTNQWLIFPIIIAIPVATELSTTLQVLYFKATGGRRLFKMAPLHHHFELIGWSETQIVQRWWLIAMLTAMIGIALALV